MWTTLLTFFKSNWIAVALGFVVAFGGLQYGKAKWTAYKSDLHTAGYNQAVQECNTTELSEALKESEEEVKEQKRLYESALDQVDSLNKSLSELNVFVESLQNNPDLQALESGDISPRTNRYLLLLNERSKVVLEEENAKND